MMCDCMTMCWIPAEITDNGRWPLPKHHPKCEDYEAERFIRVEYDGAWCVMEVNEALEYMDDVKYSDEAEQYKYEDIHLTRDQFEALPEFQGF